MPAKLTSTSDASAFTLVCGHLSTRISLDPDPRRILQDDWNGLQHLEHNGPQASTNDNRAMEMEIDSPHERRKDSEGNPLLTKSTTASGGKKHYELGLAQHQTLYNQGSVMASDLSIIGFIKLNTVQSPPIVSRHWITIDRPQQQDVVANPVKEEPVREREDEATMTESKPLKAEDSLAATLFPEQSGSQPHQRHHHQHFSVFPSSYQAPSPGMSHKPLIPSVPPGGVSGMSQDPHNGPSTAARGKTNEADAVPSSASMAQQQLYSTLYHSLNQESLVAIVALQYPDKACTRLRKWKRAQDDTPSKTQKVVSTSATTGSLVPKRLQGSPSLPIHGSPDLHPQGGVGSLSSNPTFGSLAGSSSTSVASTGSALIGSNASKDDSSAAIASASLATVIDDRKWYGLLMAAPHFLSSQFHSVPVRLNGTHGNA